MRPIACGCGAVLVALLVYGQQEPPLFRAETRLVEVSFIALDKHGAPVTDLRKEEVTLLDKGKARQIAFFNFEGASEGRLKPAPPTGIFTNKMDELAGPPRNITAIVLDSLNTAVEQQMLVKAQVMRYLRELAPSTRVAVFQLGTSLSVVHDFTDDLESLRRRMAEYEIKLPPLPEGDVNAMVRDADELIQVFGVKRGFDFTTTMSSMQDANAHIRERRLEGSLQMLEALGRHLSGIPGRKSVAWIGGGVSTVAITGSAGGFLPFGDVQNFETKIQESARRIAQDGVALYIVNSAGMTNRRYEDPAVSGTPRQSDRFGGVQTAEAMSADPNAAMEHMAATTGGRVIRHSNDMTWGIKLVAGDLRGAYTLGFYAGDEADGKWRDVKLKTTRGGVKLLSREGYLAEGVAPEAAAWTAERWRQVVFNPVGSTGIHMNAKFEMVKGQPGVVDVIVEVDGADLYFRKTDKGDVAQYEVAIAEKNATGAGRLHIDAGEATGSVVYRQRWPLSAGMTTLRIMVHDKFSGRYGTLDVAVSRLKPALQPAPPSD